MSLAIAPNAVRPAPLPAGAPARGRPAAGDKDTSAAAPAASPAPAQVAAAVSAVKEVVAIKAPNSLSFSIDESTGRTVVTVTDAETGETVRQIPSEEMLEIARDLDRMQAHLQGLLLRRQA